MSEHAVSFPVSSPALLGVYSEVADSEPGGVAIVLLNAGLLPRTGPNRLPVRIARESARQGLGALRFDLSGIGDSLPRTDGLPFRQGSLRDVQEAFAYLSSTRQIKSFVLAGLCSGADLAFEVSMNDDRVVGLVLIDGLPYSTLRSRANDQVLRLRRGLVNGRWRRLFSRSGPVVRVVHGLTNRNGAAWRGSQPSATASDGRDVPPRAEAEAALSVMLARGVKIMAVFTEGRGYNYKRQFAHMFPRLRPDAVQIEHFEGTDHTFNLLASQDRLVAAISQWSSQFVQGPSGGRASGARPSGVPANANANAKA